MKIVFNTALLLIILVTFPGSPALSDQNCWGTWQFRLLAGLLVVFSGISLFRWRMKAAHGERFRKFFFNHSVPMLLIDPETQTISEANPAASEFYGYTLDELGGLALNRINRFTPEQIHYTIRQIRTRQKSAFVFTHYLKNSEPRTVEVRSASVELRGREFLFSIIHDISERIRAEEALQNSESNNRALLRAIPDIIFHLTGQGNFLQVYGAKEDLYTNSERIIGNNVKSLVPSPIGDMTMTYIRKALDTGILQRYEYQLPLSGGLSDFEVRMVPVGPDEVIALIRNITDIRKAEADLIKAKDAAEIANKAKSAFLANMSHELRTPLNGILGFAQILKEDPSLTDQQQQGAQVIKQSGEHLLSLLNDILDLAKIESDKIDLHETVFHFPSFIREVGDSIRVRAEKKGIGFFVEPPSIQTSNFKLQTSEYVRGDERRLRQILVNLLGNAVKFTDRGSVTLRILTEKTPGFSSDKEPSSREQKTRVSFSAQEKPGFFPDKELGSQEEKTRVSFSDQEKPGFFSDKVLGSQEEKSRVSLLNLTFEVEDTGIGISQEDLQQIFDPFQQAGDEKYREQGTGLGLAITRNLAELMGGKLEASAKHKSQNPNYKLQINHKNKKTDIKHQTPNTGPGSIFRFHVTLAEASCKKETSRGKTEKITGFRGKPRKVLVVDDMRFNRELFSVLLGPLGFEIIKAASGEEGLEKAHVERPDLLIADMLMPGMDGLELVRQIRQSSVLKEKIVIISSASVYPENQQNCFKAGADGFLPKPVKKDNLLELLGQLMDMDWMYEGEDAKSETEHEEENRPALSPDRLEKLPDVLLIKLTTAAKQTDPDAAEAIIEQVREIDPSLAESLYELVKEFRFDVLQEILKEISR